MELKLFGVEKKRATLVFYVVRSLVQYAVTKSVDQFDGAS